MIRFAAMLLLLAPANALDDLVESGRIACLTDTPSERLQPSNLIAPGAPPILSFRGFDAAERGRLGNLGLMTDDAGH